jgi:cytochrome c-type biogenesis protein CcmH/NrfF
LIHELPSGLGACKWTEIWSSIGNRVLFAPSFNPGAFLLIVVPFFVVVALIVFWLPPMFIERHIQKSERGARRSHGFEVKQNSGEKSDMQRKDNDHG